MTKGLFLLKNFFDNLKIPKYDLVALNENDYNLIEKLFLDGIKLGAYDKIIIYDLNKFYTMVQALTSENQGTDEHGRVVIAMSCSIRGKTIGFITIAINQDLKDVELWYFSLLEEYRNKGLGNIYLNILFKLLNRELPNSKLLVRCNEKSFAMQKILDNNGFKQTGKNKQGFVFNYKQL
jgi:RimJ/RimL family protein N-acetyltransferase